MARVRIIMGSGTTTSETECPLTNRLAMTFETAGTVCSEMGGTMTSEIATLHYQIFIEPKGKPYLELDKWKENFLQQLEKEGKIDQLWDDKKYTIWGMPFFNETERKVVFVKSFTDFVLE